MDIFYEMDRISFQRNRDKKDLLNSKINVEEKLEKLLKWEHTFNSRLWMEYDERDNREKYFNQLLKSEPSAENDISFGTCSEISIWLRNIRPAYTAPAYNFNKYLDVLVQDIYWEDIKHESQDNYWKSASLREVEVLIELQNCLISIKMGLDRIVKLFSLYYKGFSASTTFGHIDIRENGTEKGKNFMAYVMSNKDKDELFAFLYNEYNEWIKKCVKPRDAIIHYQDFFSEYTFDSYKWIEQPIHINTKNNESIEETRLSIDEYVNRFYKFFEEILKAFLKKEPK